MNINDQLDQVPEPWKPEPGQKLVGVIVDLSERESQYGSYPVVTVETDDGTLHEFNAFHTVARQELERRKPAIGDQIGIAYHGKANGKEYEQYRIITATDDQVSHPSSSQ